MKYLFVFLAFIAIDCTTSDDLYSQEIEKKALDSLKIEINSLVFDSKCSEEFSCYSIGLGAKPCGGHWEYLVYSNSIDVVDLLAKIKNYNELEKEYNENYNILSDCFLILAPSKIVCENGKCKAIYLK
jgi:hypothetical protein